MAMGIEISWKNRLQEHCQKNQLPMPNYRFKQQSNALCQLSFQAEVEINGRWYIGNDNFPSKKAAEQSAAEKACNDLCNSDVEFHTANENVDANQHMPREHAYIERFLTNMLAERGGQIRKVHSPNVHGLYRVEITGNYRFCENVRRDHKKNRVYLLVDPIKNVYYQKCYDPDCRGFKSAQKSIETRQYLANLRVTDLSSGPQ